MFTVLTAVNRGKLCGFRIHTNKLFSDIKLVICEKMWHHCRLRHK